MSKYARITIKGENLRYTTVLPVLEVADVIAYIDLHHRKNERKTIPRHPKQEKEITNE